MSDRRDAPPRAITRRDLIAGSGLGALGLIAGLGQAGETPPEARPFAASSPRSRVLLVRREDAVDADHRVNAPAVQAMLDEAVAALSGERERRAAWGRYLHPADTVGVKITRCEWMRVGTEEAVVQAISARLGELGLPPERVLVRDGGLPLGRCTALINAASAKVHSVTGFASVLKNYINFAPTPSDYHFAASARIGEIWHLPEVEGKTRLVVADLLRPYFGPGPQVNPLHRWDYRGLLVGTDPVAVETVALAICQEKRHRFKGEEWPITPPPLLVRAADERYGLGTCDPRKIRLERLGWVEDALI